MADGTGESHESFEKKRKRYGHKSCAAAKCNNRSDNRPDLSYDAFPLDVETRKKWEVRMRRGDLSFKSVDNKFCCSKHFLPTDFTVSVTGHRRDIKKDQFLLYLTGHQEMSAREKNV